MEKEIIERIKHIETFYEQAPPGAVKEYEEAPEECIPDTEANQKAREFLASAPKKGLWMPLGKEVKVMQCWKCKNYGHRTGDKECPLFTSGNTSIEKFREMYEDPMYSILNSQTRKDQSNKLRWLQDVLNQSSTDSSDSGQHSRSEKKKKKKMKTKNKDAWVEKSVKSIKEKKRKKLSKKRKRDTSSSSSEDSHDEKKRSKSDKPSSSQKHEKKKRRNRSPDNSKPKHGKKKSKKAKH